MLRRAELLALLGGSDLELSSGRRGRLHPSLPGAGHPVPESGMTTQPSWGKTVAGLPPAGVLPLQAARFAAKVRVGKGFEALVKNETAPLPQHREKERVSTSTPL